MHMPTWYGIIQVWKNLAGLEMTLLSAKEGLQKMQELDHADIAAVLSIGTMTALMLAREPNKSRSTLPILMIAILKHKRLMMLSTMMIVRKSFKRMRTLH